MAASDAERINVRFQPAEHAHFSRSICTVHIAMMP
jgi:hypothetical protein